MRKTILLVDDQEIDRTALREIAKAEPSWQIAEVGGGQAALDLLCSSELPQLCIVDLLMPEVSGLEFLRRVRRDRILRGLRVVVVSGTRDRETIVELAKLGIEGYILKPFTADKLLATLRPIMASMPDLDAEPDVLRDLLTRTALLADDDPVAREALAQIVKAEPHWRVVEVGDGVQALEELQAGLRPDVSFVDLRMPGMDGVTLIHHIRNDPELRSLRVAVTSGERDREKIVALAQLHIEGYLLKPLDATKVRTVLRGAA